MSASADERPLLSVVVPMFNEEGNVEAFVQAVDAVLRAEQISYELILTDDGSSDATWSRICEQAERSTAVRGISLARNFGHQNALLAGLRHARGRAIVTMDGDLQHPPETIIELVRAWREGNHVVTTERRDSAETGWFKRVSSRWFYRVFSRMTGVRLAPGSSDFRLVDARVLEAMLRMRDADLFLRGMVSWLGFRSASVTYQVAPRFSGRTSYSLRKMLRLSLGAMVSFSMLPLKIGIWAGFITSALAFLEIAYILVQYFRGATVPGWASVMSVMSLMFGVLFILLGFVGLYLGKIYEILKGRPRFVVAAYAGSEPRRGARTTDNDALVPTD